MTEPAAAEQTVLVHARIVGPVTLELLPDPVAPAAPEPVDQDEAAPPDDIRLRRVIEHALTRPVPCPTCERTSPCRCVANRIPRRVEAVLAALRPWLRDPAGSDQ